MKDLNLNNNHTEDINNELKLKLTGSAVMRKNGKIIATIDDLSRHTADSLFKLLVVQQMEGRTVIISPYRGTGRETSTTTDG